MDKAKKESTNQSGESNTYTPQKVEKLEADEYLLEKALKAQENALQKVMRVKRLQAIQAKQRQHNKIVAKRKQERRNRKGGRK